MPALFPYQRAGSTWLVQRKTALLADEMGLGKTAQAIDACKRVGAFAVAVVCPASLRENWRREFERWYGDDMLPVLKIESYDMVARGALAEGEFDVLILDEAHYLKTRQSKRTRAIYGEKCDGKGGLVERCRRVYALTGTPSPNHNAELWPMLRALAPETIPGANGKPRGYHTFASKFCRMQNNGFGMVIRGNRNTAHLKEAIEPFVLRRMKAEVLRELPPIRFDQIYLDAPDLKAQSTPEMRELADEIARALDEHGVAGLQTIAAHVATLRRLTGIAKAGLCADWINEWLADGGGKIVVFAHHTDVLNIIEGDLAHRFTGVRGSSSARDRQRAVDKFQTDPDVRVFLGQIQAAGTGITLTAASDVLFVESSWVPADNEQAAMRVHRIGQNAACLVRFATLVGSIDERVQAAVMRKTREIEELFG